MLNKQTIAYANANIALIKYWGKQNENDNIPSVSSLSLTLGTIGTKVKIISGKENSLLINGAYAPRAAQQRVLDFLTKVNSLYFTNAYLNIESETNLPYGAGLASSAAFYAALATAINSHFYLKLDKKELSCLARLGSASAARSIYGGFSMLNGGLNLSHNTAYAESILEEVNLDVVMIIAIVDYKEKSISSRDAMLLSQETSPFFNTFVENQANDLNEAITALKNGCFSALGNIMEHSTLKMFAVMWSANPAIMYWQGPSLNLINLVYDIRKNYGPIAFFTMDAGPQVKILTLKKHLCQVLSLVKNSNFAQEIIEAHPGKGAYVISDK